MFLTLWLLFVAFIIATPLVWVLDNNGLVLVNWLGYRIETDIPTSILVAILFTAITFSISYLVAKILSIKFPNFLKTFFQKRHFKNLESVIHRHHQAFNLMTQMLLALEVEDKKSSKDLHKKLSYLIKNRDINNFFSGKVFLENGQFEKAAEAFEKFGESKNAKILALKSRFQAALNEENDITAIAYAKQVLSISKKDLGVATSLLNLYKKRGDQEEANRLISSFQELL